MDKPKRQTRGSRSRGKQLKKKHSEVEDEGAKSSSGEDDLTVSVPVQTVLKTEKKRKALVEQDDEPEITDTINENPQDQYECVQLSESKAAKDASKLLQINKDQPDGKKVPETQEVPYTTYIFIAILMLSLAMSSQLFRTPNSIYNNDIVAELNQLAKDFANQSPYSFKKLKSRVLSYVHHKTSPQPFVLLVASTQDGQLTAKCFAKRVAQLLTTASVIINGSKYSNTTSDDAKLDIDGHLRNVFQKGHYPTAAIINSLDSIPYGTTTLFYAYCDHDNPMYKEAAIIFTITLPQNYVVNDNELDREGLVEKYLSEDSPWVKDEKFSLDVMGALISRITDTVIVINKESKESLEKSC